MLWLVTVALNIKPMMGRKGGVVLWAEGRSATETYFYTLTGSTELKACRNKKEGFDHGVLKAELGGCIERNERATHLKPFHLDHPGSDVRTPTAFFGAVQDAGFTLIVASYRENEIAWYLSLFDFYHGKEKDTVRHRAAQKWFCDRRFVPEGNEGVYYWRHQGRNRTVLDRLQDRRVAFKRALEVATNRLPILYLSFEDMTHNVCAAVARTLNVYNNHSAVHDLQSDTTCIPRTVIRKGKGHHDMQLDDRLGKDAMACLRREITDRPAYEWMLEDDGGRLAPPTSWPRVYDGIPSIQTLWGDL